MSGFADNFGIARAISQVIRGNLASSHKFIDKTTQFNYCVGLNLYTIVG